MNTSTQVEVNNLGLDISGKMIVRSQFQLSGSRCEDRILLGFYLKMLNDKTLKPNNGKC